MLAVEIKSVQTIDDSVFARPQRFESIARSGLESHKPAMKFVVYGGDRRVTWNDVDVVLWARLADISWA